MDTQNQTLPQETKMPLFVGTNDQSILDKIQELFKDSENIEVSIMGADMYASSFHYWQLSQMSPEDRTKLLQEQKKDAQYQALLQQANVIKSIFGNQSFDPSELKIALSNVAGKKFSNSDIENFINFLFEEKLINYSNEKCAELPFHKKCFVVTIEPQQRIAVTRERIDALKTKQEFNNDQINNEIRRLESDIKELEQEIEESKNNEIVDEDGDLKKTTEHVNDR